MPSLETYQLAENSPYSELINSFWARTLSSIPPSLSCFPSAWSRLVSGNFLCCRWQVSLYRIQIKRVRAKGSPASVSASASTVKECSGLNQSQIIEALAKAENITLQQAEMVVNAFFENMADALVGVKRIEIRGFGNFKVKLYEGYKGHNLTTGDLIKVDGKKLPCFIGLEFKIQWVSYKC